MKTKYIALTPSELAARNEAKTNELIRLGYTYNRSLSIAACGVVYIKIMDDKQDMWIFDLEGGQHHNPNTVLITVR